MKSLLIIIAVILGGCSFMCSNLATLPVLLALWMVAALQLAQLSEKK